MKKLWGKIMDGVWGVFSHLPFRVLYFLSDFLLFPIVFHIIRYRRSLVRRQLSECFPEKTFFERKQIEVKFYHFFCDNIFEIIKLRNMSPERMRKHVEWVDIEAVQQRMLERDDYFAFVYIGHYCNWEWLASFTMYFGSGFVGAQIYHPLKNPYMDQMFLDMRQKFGGECIPMKEAFRYIKKLRDDGKRLVVGFIADQSPKWSGMHQWCEFLHHQTSFFIGTEKLGKRLGAEIYYLDVTRPRRGFYRAEVKFMTFATKDIPDYELTDAYARLLEQTIRREPHLWLWTHKRWKRTREEWEQRRQNAK